MSNIDEYKGALKYAFTQIGGGEPKDWEITDKNSTNDKGEALYLVFNKQTGKSFDVIDNGDQPDMGGRVFNAKSTADPENNEANFTIPDAWKNLKI